MDIKVKWVTHSTFNYKPLQVIGLVVAMIRGLGWEYGIWQCLSVTAEGGVCAEHCLCKVQLALLDEAALLIWREWLWACLWAQSGAVLWSSHAICPRCSMKEWWFGCVLSGFILTSHKAERCSLLVVFIAVAAVTTALFWHFALFTEDTTYVRCSWITSMYMMALLLLMHMPS